jgi:hypothetical protein
VRVKPLTVPRTRRCPHGVPVGPLDGYGVEADTPVASTYCEKCEALWIAGKHPAQTFIAAPAGEDAP